MNSFDRNAEKDKSAALILTILIHVGLFAAIYLLGSSGQSSTPPLQSKIEAPVVRNTPKS